MTGEEASGFLFHWEPGVATGPVLVMLHGTGGSEHDLVPLGQRLLPGAPILSPRGRVLERGMPRFFRRLAEGVFDHDNVRDEADALATWIGSFVTTADLAPRPRVAVGYSNGANIAAAMLLRHQDLFQGAVLLRPMVPLPEHYRGESSSSRVLVIAGQRDPIAPVAQAEELAKRLEESGSRVDLVVVPASHELSADDLRLAQQFLHQFS